MWLLLSFTWQAFLHVCAAKLPVSAFGQHIPNTACIYIASWSKRCVSSPFSAAKLSLAPRTPQGTPLQTFRLIHMLTCRTGGLLCCCLDILTSQYSKHVLRTPTGTTGACVRTCACVCTCACVIACVYFACVVCVRARADMYVRACVCLCVCV